MMRALLATLAVIGGASCTTASLGGRADVVRPGSFEVTGGATAALGLLKRAPGRPNPAPSFALVGAARAGVRDGVDVGWRGWAGAVPGISNVGMLLDGKLQFVDAHAFDA